jgi:hypothetical protein
MGFIKVLTKVGNIQSSLVDSFFVKKKATQYWCMQVLEHTLATPT